MSSMELIKQIKVAEEQAEGIRKRAIEEARKITVNARDEAKRLEQELLQKAIDQGNNLMKEAEADTTREIETLQEGNRIGISELKAKARGNLQEAIAYILERIVDNHGRN